MLLSNNGYTNCKHIITVCILKRISTHLPVSASLGTDNSGHYLLVVTVIFVITTRAVASFYYLSSIYGQTTLDNLYASERLSLGGQYSYCD
ncbi:hypothetical protein C5471_13700 [Photorhabdus tasmaniensis]|uniref:Haemolysin activator HlyB C-terminal domain-containing protein n=1 Tax=Photorhabdus tasmaniensis TaxID=1004159 RepID=A0ABX0GK82_9GAMM|nr:hypothetical protein [Photorhabdus tasmaniensis]